MKDINTKLFEGLEKVLGLDIKQKSEAVINKAFDKIISETKNDKINWRVDFSKYFEYGDTFRGEAIVKNPLGKELKVPVWFNITYVEYYGNLEGACLYLFNKKGPYICSSADTRIKELINYFSKEAEKKERRKDPLSR